MSSITLRLAVAATARSVDFVSCLNRVRTTRADHTALYTQTGTLHHPPRTGARGKVRIQPSTDTLTDEYFCRSAPYTAL